MEVYTSEGFIAKWVVMMAEKEKKKQIPLRISEALWKELMMWSEAEFRSINGQIEYLLTEAVKKRRGNSRGNKDQV